MEGSLGSEMVAGMEVGRRTRAREQPGQAGQRVGGGASSRHARSLGRDADDADVLPGHFLGVAQCLSNSP